MSEIRTDTINNASGDNDSGIDLSTNDQVGIKTANTTAVTVDASQRVGIGTASPADVPLSVFSGGAGTNGQLKLGYDGSNYWQIGRLDPAGTGSGNFQFKPNGGTSVLDVMSDGRIGHFASSALAGAHFTQTIDSVNGPGFLLNSTDASGNTHNQVLFRRNGSDIGSIQTTGSSTAYNTSSDHRLKENVTADWDATTRLKQLNPVRFNFIIDADTTVDGFLAHEVQSVVPEAISGTHNEVDDDGNPVYQGIDQSKLVPLLVKTIQELEARITALESE